MIVGIDQRVVALFAPQQLNGPVGNDLVGVHVQAGARPALDGVHDEFLMELALGDLLAGTHNSIGYPFVQQADLIVGNSGGFFDLCDGIDDLRMHRQAGNMEIFGRPQGLNPVIDVLGQSALPNGVVLGTILGFFLIHGPVTTFLSLPAQSRDRGIS